MYTSDVGSEAKVVLALSRAVASQRPLANDGLAPDEGSIITMIAMTFDIPSLPEGCGALPVMSAPVSMTKTVTESPAADSPEDAFARLAALVRSNDRLLAELKALDARLAEARAYLATPLANLQLGQAHRDRIQARRVRVLTILRANRLAAREFLAN
jgi:hypothetical protein